MLSTRHLLLLFGGVCSIFLLLSIQFKGPADGYEGDEESLSDDLLEFEPLNPDQGQDLHILPVPELSHRPVHQVEQDDGISFEKSPSQDGGADALAFRKQLESSTSFTSHSPTLTFTHIYVVSLPTRQDRRANMSRIADALNLKFTFIDAVLKDSHLIQWIGERVAETRVKKRPHLAKAFGVLPEEVGGMGIGSIWLSRQGDQGNGGELQLPSLNEPKYDNLDWVAYLDKATDTTGTPLALEQDKEPLEERLQPNDPNFNVTAALWDSVEPMESRQIVAAVLSTWFSHTRAMKAMLANGDESALFLEDDVDIEWDIEGRWASIYRRLPSDWDVVFLGHCWGREMTKPTNLHPHLFTSVMPRCLHAYALSKSGVQKVLGLLSDPWVAYQAPVDVTIPTLAQTGRLVPYSVEPPLIIQSKDSPSDIQPGTGSTWRGLLADSTMERIWRDEEKDVPILAWSEAIKDPSVTRPRLAGKQY